MALRLFVLLYYYYTVNGRLGLCAAVWLQAKVRDHELGLQPRLYAGLICDDSTAEAAYAAIVRYIHEPYSFHFRLSTSPTTHRPTQKLFGILVFFSQVEYPSQ